MDHVSSEKVVTIRYCQVNGKAIVLLWHWNSKMSRMTQRTHKPESRALLGASDKVCAPIGMYKYVRCVSVGTQ